MRLAILAAVAIALAPVATAEVLPAPKPKFNPPRGIEGPVAAPEVPRTTYLCPVPKAGEQPSPCHTKRVKPAAPDYGKPRLYPANPS